MATRIRPAEGDLYERDFYLWAERQAELLRAGRLADLDLDNLILEVEGLADAKKGAVRSRIRTIIEHLLKLEHSPASNPRAGWRDTVRAQRDDLRDDLTPGLRAIAETELPELYARGRERAAGSLRDHGEDAAADALAETCPYDLERITGDWLP
jgi:hypothetical protein